MAGAGVKLFTAGSQLPASEVNTYLMDQVVAYFADSAARDAAFGGAQEPSLSAGRVCYLFSDNKLYVYDNTSNWVEIGAQVEDGEITTAKIAALAVTTAKIADSAVTSAKIENDTIVNADIKSNAAIAYSKLDIANSVATTDLATGAPQAGFRSSGAGSAVTLSSNNYNIVAGDLGKLLEIAPSANTTVTITAANDANFAVGDRVDVLQTTATHVVTIAGSGVTVNAFDGGLKLSGQFAAATLVKRAATFWVAIGNLTT